MKKVLVLSIATGILSVSCIALLVSLIVILTGNSCSSEEQICNIYCDGRDPQTVSEVRNPVNVTLFGRVIRLSISDIDNMAFASISDGDPGDAVWLDRSFDGGVSVGDGSLLGVAEIRSGFRDTNTKMFNIDKPADYGIYVALGAMRACGKVNDRPDIVCTSWARSTVYAENPINAAATALMQFYDIRGLWKTTGWWNAANALTALIDYMKYTGQNTYQYVIETTFEKNKYAEDGNFTNYYIDDTLWWGLGWVLAYDLTGNSKYLDMAKIDADYSYQYKDNICDGGLWWSAERGYKNAIVNELFIKLAAALHNRIESDTEYLRRAIEVWTWFRSSGMINSNNLINDGLTSDCINNGQVTWSYNQGVILGGLVELYKATTDQNYITEARAIADAVLGSTDLNPDGVLFDYG